MPMGQSFLTLSTQMRSRLPAKCFQEQCSTPRCLQENNVQHPRRQRHTKSQLLFMARSEPVRDYDAMESHAVQPYRSSRDRLHTARVAKRLAKAILLSATVASATAIGVGAGVAQAASSPNVVGQKYSDARGTLSGAGFGIVVSTTVGDQVSWPDCIVTHQEDRSAPAPENTSASSTSQTLLSLNCDAQVASATAPGNSLASPEGRAAAASAAASAASATPAAPKPGG
jgi:hypothetical protein